LLRAAHKNFRSPVWTDYRSTDWPFWNEYDDEHGSVCSSYGPHNYVTVGKHVPGAVGLVRMDDHMSLNYVSLVGAAHRALKAHHSVPTAFHIRAERRLACMFNPVLPADVYSPGSDVILHGLVMRSELNGRCACLRVRIGKRWSADVDGLASPISLKPMNFFKFKTEAHDIAGDEGLCDDHISAEEPEDAKLKQEMTVEPGKRIIEYVYHAERAATISPEESAILAHELWADEVERLLQTSLDQTTVHGHVCQTSESALGSETADSSPPLWDRCSESGLSCSNASRVSDVPTVIRQSQFGDRVFVLRWTRNPYEIKEALNSYGGLEPVQAAAEAMGHSCRHVSGAFVFLYPNQFRGVLRTLEGMSSLELRPYHTVVNEAFKPLVEEAAQQLRSKANVRLRSQRTVALIADAECEESCAVLVVERTFYNLMTPPRPHDPASVVQSEPTRGALNPRVCTVLDHSNS